MSHMKKFGRSITPNELFSLYGWRNSKKEPVANRELWERLIPYFENPRFSFEKVKGHSGEKDWNDYVDRLAVEAKKTKV